MVAKLREEAWVMQEAFAERGFKSTEAETMLEAAELITAYDEALKLALTRMPHKAACYSIRPTSEWSKHGSGSLANCDCEIKAVRAARAKARAESSQ